MLKKITILCLKNKFFWIKKADEILRLRNQFRIIGNLIRIPLFNQKKNFFLFLSLEEIMLGIEIGFLRLKFFTSQKRYILSFLLKNFEKDRFFNKKNYPRKILQNSNLLLKRSETIKKWREIGEIISKICNYNFIKLNFCKVKKFSKIHSSKKHNRGTKKTFLLICFENLIKNFKENDFFKYSIFKNFWQRGFSLSCGMKFGCSYLAYAGNIMDVHSYLSILTIPIQYNSITPKLMIAFGRVGTITKKFNILVNLNKFYSIKCSTLRWHNFLP